MQKVTWLLRSLTDIQKSRVKCFETSISEYCTILNSNCRRLKYQLLVSLEDLEVRYMFARTLTPDQPIGVDRARNRGMLVRSRDTEGTLPPNDLGTCNEGAMTHFVRIAINFLSYYELYVSVNVKFGTRYLVGEVPMITKIMDVCIVYKNSRLTCSNH